MQLVYETMYILRSDLGEEQVEQAINIKPAPGTRGRTNRNSASRQASSRHEINKQQRDGIYVQMNYQGPGTL